MGGLQEIIQWETHAGEPVRAAGVTVTPLAWALTVRLPFGGLVWNTPVAVLVDRDGAVERLPIVDVTRIALIGIGLFSAVVAMLAIGRKAKDSDG